LLLLLLAAVLCASSFVEITPSAGLICKSPFLFAPLVFLLGPDAVQALSLGALSLLFGSTPLLGSLKSFVLSSPSRLSSPSLFLPLPFFFGRECCELILFGSSFGFESLSFCSLLSFAALSAFGEFVEVEVQIIYVVEAEWIVVLIVFAEPTPLAVTGHPGRFVVLGAVVVVTEVDLFLDKEIFGGAAGPGLIALVFFDGSLSGEELFDHAGNLVEEAVRAPVESSADGPHELTSAHVMQFGANGVLLGSACGD